MSKIEISAHYNCFFEKYNDKFPDVSSIKVFLNEKFESVPNEIIPTKGLAKLTNREFVIDITFSVYLTKKGVSSYSKEEVYRVLEYRMNKELENYKTNIDLINPTLTTQLHKLGIDISSNKDKIANEIKSSISLENYDLDFNKRIATLTNEDLYQLGKVLIVSEHTGTIFTKIEIVELTEEKLFSIN